MDRKKNSTTRCVLYARVSTLKSQHPEMQLAELRDYARRRGWKIAAEFTDRISGAKDQRPALNKLMAAAHRREFDAVCVWKLDRWGRSLKHLVVSLAELEALGIAFVSLHDNLDLTTPSGKLMFNIIGSMAEFERSLIVERVRSGLQHAISRGVRLGRPRKLVNHVAIARMRRQGVPWKEVARREHCAIMTAMAAVNGHSNKPAAN